jgi:hypothetical protein
MDSSKASKLICKVLFSHICVSTVLHDFSSSTRKLVTEKNIRCYRRIFPILMHFRSEDKTKISSSFRLCWEQFGWVKEKADELLLPVLREYNKHEVSLASSQ